MPEDEDTIGQTVRAESLDPSALELCLMVLGGPDSGRYFTVGPDGGVIGRGEDVAFRLRDDAVSRKHARVEWLEPERRYYIRDLGSTNGVFVQGEASELRALSEGDRIQLTEHTVLRVRFQTADEREVIDNLERAATTDALTGLRNRRYLMERLDEEVAYADRHRLALSLLLLDLDHFKRVNDAWGHQAGDTVLRELGGTLIATVRAGCVAARYGGEEFVIVNRGGDLNATVQFADRLCRIFAKRTIEVSAGHSITVTVSIGVVEHTLGTTVQDLLVRADSALYAAKRAGRNRVCYWVQPAELGGPDPDAGVRSTHKLQLQDIMSLRLKKPPVSLCAQDTKPDSEPEGS